MTCNRLRTCRLRSGRLRRAGHRLTIIGAFQRPVARLGEHAAINGRTGRRCRAAMLKAVSRSAATTAVARFTWVRWIIGPTCCWAINPSRLATTMATAISTRVKPRRDPVRGFTEGRRVLTEAGITHVSFPDPCPRWTVTTQ